MRIGLNKRRTSAVLKEHGGYDATKGRSRDRYLASLPVVPEVPDCVPDRLRAILTPEQCEQLEGWLARLREQRRTDEMKKVVADALSGIQRLIDGLANGNVAPSAEENAALVGELGTALGLFKALFEAEAMPPPGAAKG
jgi:hypothetical protein